MPAMPAVEPPTMRERDRAQVRDEVKQAALRELTASGPAGLSVAAISKQLGVSAPALYRYFARRDELLAGSSSTPTTTRRTRGAPQPASPQACGRAPGSRHSRLPVLGWGYGRFS